MTETVSCEVVAVHGEEAVAEVLSHIKRIRARCLDPIITSEDIGSLLRSHFGLSPPATTRLRNHVVRVLRALGWLVVWDTRELAEKTIVEYRLCF